MKKWIIFGLLMLMVLSAIVLYRTRNLSQEAVDEPTGQLVTTSALQLQETVAVTPDEKYPYGAFCRANYLESANQFFVTFGGSSPLATQAAPSNSGGAETGRGYSYKIYDADFKYTGENGVIASQGGDSASVYVNGYYYFLSSAAGNWKILKIDTATWQVVATVDVEIDHVHEATNDQMLAYANDQLIVSSLYDPNNTATRVDQKLTDPKKGYATHNRLYDLDLNFIDYFILDDVPHINGSSLVFVDGIYNYVTATAYAGDIIVMQYDQDWKYLGSQSLVLNGNWSQGTVYDPASQRFYVTYIDLGEKDANGRRLLTSSLNVMLAVFDHDWNLLESEAVTSFSSSLQQAGRPYVILYDGLVYVSYDVETFGEQHQENKDWQCLVSIYEQR